MTEKRCSESGDATRKQPASPLPPDATMALGPSTDGPGSRSDGELLDRTEPGIELSPTSPEEGLTFLGLGARPGSLGRLAQYEVLEVLGRGGFGIVLKAFDEKLHRVVAVKVLGPALAGNATARKRFLREARAAAAVCNEHVVGIYAVDEQPIPYLVMEYVPGKTLQDKIDRGGPLGLVEVLRIGSQVAEGLAAAHRQGLIHRDIKPGNILLENGVERVKLTDFGLARAADDASLTQSGVIAGTPLYMAPEQAQGGPIDHRADLFSFGSVLYALCAGRPPFWAPTALTILNRVCEDTPQPLREINPDIPEWLAGLIGKLHEKQPEARIQSAAEVVELFRGHLVTLRAGAGPTSLTGARGAVVKPRPRPKQRRGWALSLGLATLLTVAAGSLAFALWPRPTNGNVVTGVRGPQPHRLDQQRRTVGALLKSNQPEEALRVLDAARTEVEQAAIDETERTRARAEVQALRAEALRHQGKIKEADDELRQARTALEQLAADRPDDAAVAASLADMFLAEHEARLWIALPPVEVKSQAGARMARLADQSILVSGVNASADSYTVAFDRPAAPVAALRLEALTHPSLPRNGPGRHESGNFQLAEITIHDAPPAPQAKMTPHSIARAWASYHWVGQQVERAFDNNRSTVWHVWSRTGQDHWAIFAPARPIAPPDGNRLIVQLHHITFRPGINLGRFRVSVTAQSEPLRDDSLIQLARSLDGWSRVAGAHVLRQQWESAHAALMRVASAPEGLAGPEQLLLALVHQQQGRADLAAQAIERATTWGIAHAITGAFLDVAFDVVRPPPEEAAKGAAWFHLRSRWHSQHQRSSEAAADLGRALAQSPTLSLQARDIDALNALAQSAAERGQWPEVRDALLRLIEIDAQPYWEWHRSGLVLAHLGEVDRYRHHRATMLEQFGSTQDPVTAERLAKFGALLPAEGDALRKLADLADRAVARGAGQPILPHAQLARGLIEYRQENHGAAERWLQQVLLAPNVGWAVRLPAEFVVAMSQQQRGQRKEARDTLARAMAQMDKEVPQPGSPAVGTAWPEWLICQMLRREAQGLIEENKPAPKP